MPVCCLVSVRLRGPALWLRPFLLLAALLAAAAATADVLRLDQTGTDPLGGHASIWEEEGAPLGLEAAMERVLAEGLERGLVDDAAIAQNEAQAKGFWSLREHQSAAQKPEGAVWKHDVSTPISKIAQFIDEASAAMTRFAPGARILPFGHLGDGNIHFDVLQPPGGDPKAHTARRDEAARIVHDIVAGLGGSISAEHGLGSMKSAEALRYKAAAEVAAMRAVRHALDPAGIMNPRVLF